MESKYKRIVVVGNNYGVPLLIKYIPADLIKGIIVASIRPEDIDELSRVANDFGVKFLIQPKFNTREYLFFFKEIEKLDIDLIICNSYSMIIREDILNLVQYNAINVHWALLPKNRGPNPIQWAIIKGDTETGVTFHYMDNGLDSGDIIVQKKVEIGFEDTWVTISQKITLKTEELIKEEIPKILGGVNKRFKQEESRETSNKRLTPESPRINFAQMPDIEIYNLIRAQVKPLKGAYVEHKGQKIYFNEFVEYKNIRLLREKYGKFNLCNSPT